MVRHSDKRGHPRRDEQPTGKVRLETHRLGQTLQAQWMVTLSSRTGRGDAACWYSKTWLEWRDVPKVEGRFR